MCVSSALCVECALCAKRKKRPVACHGLGRSVRTKSMDESVDKRDDVIVCALRIDERPVYHPNPCYLVSGL
jgi:hypothetical protein